MKILILYGKSLSINSKELGETAERLGHEVMLGSILDVSSNISSSGSRFWLKNQEITEFDLCFIRSFGPGTCEQLTRRISLIEHMELSGIRVVNPCYSFRRARDKYATQYTLAQAGLPIVNTHTTENLEIAYTWSKELGTSVYKPILSSMGKGSLKLDDPDLAYNAWKMLGRVGQPFIIQEFIPNLGKDIRVFVVGKKVIGSAYKIASAKNWKTNVAQGGIMVGDSVSEKFHDLGVKATEAMRLDYAGVDILESKEGPVILEANGSPGWQALKKIVKVDIAEKIINYVT